MKQEPSLPVQRIKLSPIARLNPGQVRHIRRRLRAGESQSSIALHYGVSQATISNIDRRKIYRGVR